MDDDDYDNLMKTMEIGEIQHQASLYFEYNHSALTIDVDHIAWKREFELDKQFWSNKKLLYNILDGYFPDARSYLGLYFPNVLSNVVYDYYFDDVDPDELDKYKDVKVKVM